MSDLLELTFKPDRGMPPSSLMHRLLVAISEAGDIDLVLTLQKKIKMRTGKQNRYYFGVVVRSITKALRAAGNDMDEPEVHEYLKSEVGKLTRIAVLPDGEVVKIPGSTKRLNTTEFNDYVTMVTSWAASMGIEIDPPG